MRGIKPVVVLALDCNIVWIESGRHMYAAPIVACIPLGEWQETFTGWALKYALIIHVSKSYI